MPLLCFDVYGFIGLSFGFRLPSIVDCYYKKKHLSSISCFKDAVEMREEDYVFTALKSIPQGYIPFTLISFGRIGVF